jgi:GNAT superfamily N-acetyltransferase
MNLSFSKDPSLSARLFDLLDEVFPGIKPVASNARAMGASWESVSTPFVCFEGEQAISHVGVIELPLILLGNHVRVGSIHGVATHPGYRGRGYFRKAIESALSYADSRYETLILTTEHPEYFQPFGFRVIKEHLFRFKPDSIDCKDGIRLIDTASASDIELLHRLLETREPVSNVVGAGSEKGVFCFNEGSRSLYYLRELDVMVCMEIEDARLKLFDIVGPSVPSLVALLERIPHNFEEVLINFSPDKLSIESEHVFHLFDHDGPSYFMARGPFAAESHAFSLPRSART